LQYENILQELKNQEKLRLIVFESDQKVFSAGVDIADHLPETAPEIKQEVKPEVTDTEKLKTSIDSYFKNKATEKVG